MKTVPMVFLHTKNSTSVQHFNFNGSHGEPIQFYKSKSGNGVRTLAFCSLQKVFIFSKNHQNLGFGS